MGRLRWLKALEPEELAEGECKTVTVGRRPLCLARVGGRYGAIDDTCPHRGAALGAGDMVDGYVQCPLHAWQFNPFTGTLRAGYPCGLTGYQTEERADGVYVGLPEPRRDPVPD